MRVLPPAFVPRRFPRIRSGNSDDGQSTRYAQIIRLAQTCSERTVLRLAELMQSGDDRVALLASQALLDQAFGKSRAFTDLPSVAGAATEKRLRNLIAILAAEFDDEVAES